MFRSFGTLKGIYPLVIKRTACWSAYSGPPTSGSFDHQECLSLLNYLRKYRTLDPNLTNKCNRFIEQRKGNLYVSGGQINPRNVEWELCRLRSIFANYYVCNTSQINLPDDQIKKKILVELQKHHLHRLEEDKELVVSIEQKIKTLEQEIEQMNQKKLKICENLEKYDSQYYNIAQLTEEDLPFFDTTLGD